MFSFRKRKVETEAIATLASEVARLGGELVRTQSELRLLQTEQATVHDQVRKWMRRAIAAERNQEREPQPDARVTPASRQTEVWGGRGRWNNAPAVNGAAD